MAELDLGAIERRANSSIYYGIAGARDDALALVALVRRLQQENERLEEELTDAANVEISKDFLITTYRGRVEELTEALRALMAVIDGPVEWGSWRGIATGTDTPAFMQARRLLAGVVPE